MKRLFALFLCICLILPSFSTPVFSESCYGSGSDVDIARTIPAVETTEPETTEPEPTEPETTEAEATESETTEPEATEAETTEPETTEPEATEPEATEAETTESETTEPETTEPETTEPEASDPELSHPFEDAPDNAWFTPYIRSVYHAGLMNGVTEDRFAPNDTVTRGMFVTVLGRFEGIDTDYWSGETMPQFFKQDVDNDDYYAAHIRWGVCNGIVNGVNDFLFAPNRPITREQMAKLIAYYLESMGHSIATEESVTDISVFSDREEISSWAVDSVLSLVNTGILTGYEEKDGTFTFRPKATATRAQCAAVFCRVMEGIIRSDEPEDLPQSISISKDRLTLPEGYSFRLFAETFPEDASILWRSSDNSVVSVDQDGLATYVGPGYADISVYTRNGLYAVCQVFCDDPVTETPDDGSGDQGGSGDNTEDSSGDNTGSNDNSGDNEGDQNSGSSGSDNNGNGDSGSNDTGDESTPPANLANGNMTRDEKMLFLFGETVKDPRYYYNGNQAATEADMVDVWVKAWDLKKNGEKYTREWKLKVHKNLADTVKAIFEEIYNGPEKFPIHDMYCYAWVGKSEHTIGTAIDINYNENYYCEADGTPITGDYWKPGEDPYSIPPNGDVAKAFAKYGYIWGINWNSGKKDYMHFSFFGT